MSMHLNFEPHSWYKGFAIVFNPDHNDDCEWTYNTDSKNCIIHGHRVHPSDEYCEGFAPKWKAVTDNGNTYRVDELHARTLNALYHKIIEYRKGRA